MICFNWNRLAVVVFLAACNRGPPYDVAWMAPRLVAAGYTVTPAAAPAALAVLGARPGVLNVSCIDALKARKTDTFCVIRCADVATCNDVIGNTGESYGDTQRGPSVLVHQQCALDPSWTPSTRTPSFDCTEARRAINAF